MTYDEALEVIKNERYNRLRNRITLYGNDRLVIVDVYPIPTDPIQLNIFTQKLSISEYHFAISAFMTNDMEIIFHCENVVSRKKWFLKFDELNLV